MALASRKIGYDEVVTRDIHFPMNRETVARHWFNKDPWCTHWMNAILGSWGFSVLKRHNTTQPPWFLVSRGVLT